MIAVERIRIKSRFKRNIRLNLNAKTTGRNVMIEGTFRVDFTNTFYYFGLKNIHDVRYINFCTAQRKETQLVGGDLYASFKGDE